MSEMLQMTIKKYFSYCLILCLVLFAQSAFCATAESSSDFVDDSLKDISIVVGAGVSGAILGLSTLSFVDEPSLHLKNIAVGGSIGIVIGVGIVMFSQASRSSSGIGSTEVIQTNSDKFATLTRHEFLDYKIVKNDIHKNSLNYNFHFSF
jgi:hypothetical protein